jgi:hypothetical protein
VHGPSHKSLETQAAQVVSILVDWCASTGLQLSAAKSQMLYLRGNLDPRRPPLVRLYGHSLKLVDSFKYLGVWLSKNLSPITHAKTISAKGVARLYEISRLSKASWGFRTRDLMVVYRGVFLPIVTYAVSFWHGAAPASVARILIAAQRRVLVGATQAYKTISADAVQVIAGVPPIDLYCIYLTNCHKTPQDKTAHWEALLDSWQTRWTNSDKGRVTYRFFPDVRERLQNKHFQTDHYITQVVSGHGHMRATLHRFTLVPSPLCEADNENDDVEHWLYHCSHFLSIRERTISLCTSNAYTALVVSSNFSLFSAFCREAILLVQDPSFRTGEEKNSQSALPCGRDGIAVIAVHRAVDAPH